MDKLLVRLRQRRFSKSVSANFQKIYKYDPLLKKYYRGYVLDYWPFCPFFSDHRPDGRHSHEKHHQQNFLVEKFDDVMT